MRKFIGIYVLAALILTFVLFVFDTKASVDIVLGSLHTDLHLWQFCTALFLMFFAVLLVCGACCDFWMKKVEKSILQKSENKADHEALFLLLKTMTSTTEGDMKSARKYLKNLEDKIGAHVIIDVLKTKILKGEKKFDELEKLSEKLLENKDASLVGLKSLIESGQNQKHFQKALASANQAFEIRKDLYWVIENTFYLRASSGDYKGALEVLEVGKSKKMISKEKYDAFKAVALYEIALKEKKSGNQLLYSADLLHAVELCPTFVPAALELADFYAANDKKRTAEKVLKNVWRQNPTTDVAQKYLALYAKDSPCERAQRMESFSLLNIKQTSINHFIKADLDMKAGLYDKAKAELELFLIKNPATKKIAKLICQFEKKVKHNKDAALSWEKRALSADDECLWVCSNCGKTKSKWHAFCDECHAFNAFEWMLCVSNQKNGQRKK